MSTLTLTLMLALCYLLVLCRSASLTVIFLSGFAPEYGSLNTTTLLPPGLLCSSLRLDKSYRLCFFDASSPGLLLFGCTSTLRFHFDSSFYYLPSSLSKMPKDDEQTQKYEITLIIRRCRKYEILRTAYNQVIYN